MVHKDKINELKDSYEKFNHSIEFKGGSCR
jgi:hypothetical protein